MKHKILITAFLILHSPFYILHLSAATYFIAPNGSDTNNGTIAAPFATLTKAQSVVAAGDTVYIRGGVYKLINEQVMEFLPITQQLTNHRAAIACIFKFDKSGTAAKPICYFGYPNERPVFDMNKVKPENYWVVSFFVNASYLHFRNFEVVGTQVVVTSATNSWCFANISGSHNIYENLAAHDGMATGFWIEQGTNNLVLNCDSYNNWDSVSADRKGGNTDGFGGHLYHNETDTGNIFRGCRAWCNSDDGYDLINTKAAFVIENCWSFRNGYSQNGDVLANGAGFKSGGYAMNRNPKVPSVVPRHTVRFCLAVDNKAQGFYANHQLGGIDFYNNTAFRNPVNFNMVNRLDNPLNPPTDVGGYGHNVINNLSYQPRVEGRDVFNIDTVKSNVKNNSWQIARSLADSDFESLDITLLAAPRQSDGSLPDIALLKPAANSILKELNIGYRKAMYRLSTIHPWTNAKVGFIGNSITDPNSYAGKVKKYWQFLQEWLDITPYVYAISGRQWNDVPRQAEKLKTEHADDVDAIIVFMGTNDFNAGVPIGKWYNEKDTTVWVAQGGKPKQLVKRKHRSFIFSNQTCKGRINIGLKCLKELYPDKQIVLLTPIHRSFANFGEKNMQPDENYQNAAGEYIDAYVQAIKEAANLWSVSVIDLNAVSGLNPMVEQQLNYFYDGSFDRLHPSTAGQERMAKTIMYQLLTLPCKL